MTKSSDYVVGDYVNWVDPDDPAADTRCVVIQVIPMGDPENFGEGTMYILATPGGIPVPVSADELS